MKHERNFEPWRKEEDPHDEPFPAWVQILFWSAALVFGMAFYVGLFHVLMWLLS